MQNNLTWQQLFDYINSSNVDMDEEVFLYDNSTGAEYNCDLVEYNEEEEGWVPRISFRTEESND